MFRFYDQGSGLTDPFHSLTKTSEEKADACIGKEIVEE